MKIYKYPVDMNDIVDHQPIVIKMPREAVVLNCLIQDAKEAGEVYNTISIWALCDPGRPSEDRTFFFAVTGGELDFSLYRDYEYINTLQLSSGIVLHVFELLR